MVRFAKYPLKKIRQYEGRCMETTEKGETLSSKENRQENEKRRRTGLLSYPAWLWDSLRSLF